MVNFPGTHPDAGILVIQLAESLKELHRTIDQQQTKTDVKICEVLNIFMGISTLYDPQNSY